MLRVWGLGFGVYRRVWGLRPSGSRVSGDTVRASMFQVRGLKVRPKP